MTLAERLVPCGLCCVLGSAAGRGRGGVLCCTDVHPWLNRQLAVSPPFPSLLHSSLACGPPHPPGANGSQMRVDTVQGVFRAATEKAASLGPRVAFCRAVCCPTDVWSCSVLPHWRLVVPGCLGGVWQGFPHPWHNRQVAFGWPQQAEGRTISHKGTLRPRSRFATCRVLNSAPC